MGNLTEEYIQRVAEEYGFKGASGVILNFYRASKSALIKQQEFYWRHKMVESFKDGYNQALKDIEEKKAWEKP